VIRQTKPREYTMTADNQIFLSYARKDIEQVEILYQRLVEAGFRPWMDTKDILPGEQWQSSIQRAIRDSDFIVVCLSENSVDRRGWIQREIKQALDAWQGMLDSDIYLIPVRLHDCEAPESLGDFQWVDLFESDGWDRLVKALQVGVDRRATRDVAVAEPRAAASTPPEAAGSARPGAQDAATLSAETDLISPALGTGDGASSQLADQAYLRQFVVDHFSFDELRDLAFDLGIDYESLPHGTVQQFARELIAHLKRRNQLHSLVEEVVRRRPDHRLAQMLSG